MVIQQRSLIFAVPHSVGSLEKALSIFSRHGVNLTKIESRPNASRLLQNHGSSPIGVDDDGGVSDDHNVDDSMRSSPRIFDSRRGSRVYDFQVNVDPHVSNDVVQTAVQELLQSRTCVNVTFLGGEQIPWFPRNIKDLDLFNHQVLEAGGELQSDHPGFSDKEYRSRREMIAEIAMNYNQGEKIPNVEYTQSEKETWGKIYEKLIALYPKYACREVNYMLPLLQQNCGYSATNVPQLQDVSDFLKDTTGFRLRPVSGLLSTRDFLNGLAFRVFHSTQYLRHHTKPFYTPEPDIVHELMGHAPLFADADFADFSQEIGLASLGASDEDIEKLGTVYWYTVEFGLCRQDGENKAYGAGLMSSFGELEYSMSKEPEIRPFDPAFACDQPYPITTYQPIYYLSESFERMKDQMRAFAATLSRPFTVRYNAYTESVQVLNNRRELVQFANTLKSHAALLQSAIERIEHLDRSSLIFAEENTSTTAGEQEKKT